MAAARAAWRWLGLGWLGLVLASAPQPAALAQPVADAPIITRAGYGLSSLTVSSLEGGTFTVQAEVVGGIPPLRVEGVLDFLRRDGTPDSVVFGTLTDADGDDVYELHVGITPRSVPAGSFVGVRVRVVDAAGREAVWPEFQVPLSLHSLRTLRIEPLISTLAVGQQGPITVTAVFDNGQTSNVSGREFGTRYVVHDPSIARVDAAGVLTAISPGTTIVTVSNNATEMVAAVVVERDALDLVGLTVTPSATVTLNPGEEVQLVVTGRLRGGEERSLAAVESTSYRSNNAAVAQVSRTGLVRAVAGGTAIITVSNGGFDDVAVIEVSGPPPGSSPPAPPAAPSADASPPAPAAPPAPAPAPDSSRSLVGFTVTASQGLILNGVGFETQLRVEGVFSDSSVVDLTAAQTGTTYRVSEPDVVEVTADGLVRSRNQGAAAVTVENDGVETSVPVVVRF